MPLPLSVDWNSDQIPKNQVWKGKIVTFQERSLADTILKQVINVNIITDKSLWYHISQI